MKYLKYVAAVFILLFSGLSIPANGYSEPNFKIKGAPGLHIDQDKPRMYLIAVIDTDDKDIGKRCESDLDEVTFAFEDLAGWLDVEETIKIIKGDEFNKAAVNDAIDNWLPSQQLNKDDIVFFYYSGHGFRYPEDVSEYPRMWLKTSEDQNIATTNLRMEEDIYDRIVKMGAGVNIILSDCCNTTAAGDNADYDNVIVPNSPKVAHKRPNSRQANSDDEMDNGDKLFIPEKPFSILATAAAKGEFAGGKAENGGFFTAYFLQALSKCIYDTEIEPAWENIFDYTNEKAGYWARSAACPKAKHNEQGRCVQTAKFKKTEGSD